MPGKFTRDITTIPKIIVGRFEDFNASYLDGFEMVAMLGLSKDFVRIRVQEESWGHDENKNWGCRKLSSTIFVPAMLFLECGLQEGDELNRLLIRLEIPPRRLAIRTSTRPFWEGQSPIDSAIEERIYQQTAYLELNSIPEVEEQGKSVFELLEIPKRIAISSTTSVEKNHEPIREIGCTIAGVAVGLLILWGIIGILEGNGFLGGILVQFRAIVEIVELALKIGVLFGAGYLVYLLLKWYRATKLEKK